MSDNYVNRLGKKIFFSILLFFVLFLNILNPVAQAQASETNYLAQNVAPTLYCLGSCVGPTPTSQVNPSITTAQPSSSQISSSVSLSPSPCLSPSVSVSGAENKGTIQSHKGGGGGFFGGFFGFFAAFFLLLLQLLGLGGFFPSPTPTPVPTPTPAPSPSAVPSPSPSGGAPCGGSDIPPHVSQNWGGYVYDITPTQTTASISASWKVPTLACDKQPQETMIMGQWVGMGGYAEDDAELLPQLGIELDCINGAGSDLAWTERFPDDPIDLDTNVYPVNPGDMMSAAVQYKGKGTYMTWMTNTTQKWTITAPMKYSILRPPHNGDLDIEIQGLILPPYDSLGFSGTYSVNGGAMQALSTAPGLYYLNLVDSTPPYAPKEQTSPVTGTSFTMPWVKY